METDKLIVLSEMSDDEQKLVQTQLKIILTSTHFNSAKQLQRFLEYIVAKTLSGEGKLLKQYTIGVEALELPDDFDSDTNPIVRIMGGRVRKRLIEFYKNSDNSKIIIDVPKGSYIPEFKYSIDKRIPSIDQKLETNEKNLTSTGPRLALISFSDKAEGKTSHRLLKQTTDLLAKEFSRFVSFNLIVYNPIGDKSESHATAGEVKSDYILALYVQKLPNKQYELVCRLVKTSSEELIWSESYYINAEIEVAKQVDVICKIIAVIADLQQGKLQLHWSRTLLLDKENIPKQFKALAYFRQHYDNININTITEAFSIFKDALTRNPNDVIANILFADFCRRDFVFGFDHIDSALKRGVECAERATHLRRDSCEAHFALGGLLFSQGEWERSYDELNLARSISSAHGIIECGCGFYFCLMGKWDEGLLLAKKAINLSNTFPSWYHMSPFLFLYNKGKYKQALKEAKKIVAPTIPHGPLARCISYAQIGKIEKAKIELNELTKIIPDLEKNGKARLLRMFSNEELVEKIWSGLEIAYKA